MRQKPHQITVRVSEELKKEIEENCGDDQSQSDWVRGAIREKLDRPNKNERLEELKERVDRIESTPFVRWFL